MISVKNPPVEARHEVGGGHKLDNVDTESYYTSTFLLSKHDNTGSKNNAETMLMFLNV